MLDAYPSKLHCLEELMLPSPVVDMAVVSTENQLVLAYFDLVTVEVRCFARATRLGFGLNEVTVVR
jgi:hypothetical protein